MAGSRVLAVGAVVFVVVAACSGEPSMSVYAADVESLVTEMNDRLDELDDELPVDPDLAVANSYAKERVSARYAFLDAMRALEAPADAADLHDTALAIMERLARAEARLAERVAQLDTAIGLDEIWSTPEGVAARAVDEEAIALCHAAQDEFDQTESRAGLEGVPWIPPEMKETIRVTFGCDAEDR